MKTIFTKSFNGFSGVDMHLLRSKGCGFISKIRALTYNIVKDEEKVGIEGYIMYDPEYIEPSIVSEVCHIELFATNEYGKVAQMDFYNVEFTNPEKTKFIAKCIHHWRSVPDLPKYKESL
jgi:hypothetical protein